MKKNTAKYKSYHKAISIIKNAARRNDDLHCIASIALIESIISDRFNSFITYHKLLTANELNAIDKISITKKIKIIQRFYRQKPFAVTIISRKGKAISKDDLFSSVRLWCIKRNNIIHGFASSKPGMPPIQLFEFFSVARDTCIEGEELLKLVLKWHTSSKSSKR